MSTTFLPSTPIWTRRIANELWSGPVTPLTYSLLATPMAEHMVRRPLRVAGLDRLAELPVLRHHASHVYVNAALLTEVIRLLPGSFRSEGLLGLLPETARAGLGHDTSWLAGGSRAIGIALRAWQHEPSWAPWERAEAFDRECALVRHELGNRGTFGVKPSADELRAELLRVRERLGRYLEVVSWGMVFAYVFYHLLHELCRRWAPGLDADHAALTVGLPDVASLQAHYDLRALTSLIATHPTIAAAIAAPDFKTAASLLADDGGAAGQAFRRLLDQHGHRLTGRDLSCPTWRESPAMVVELAAPATRDAGAAPGLDHTAVTQRRLVATARLDAALSGGIAGAARHSIFRVVLANAQRYYALRENMRYHADFFMARLRQVALALGADLVRRGQLTRPDDVFWLDVDELMHADERADSKRERVAAGREAHARDQRLPPPETLDGNGEHPITATQQSQVLRGEMGSPGRCEGRAQLVHDPADFERVAAGDVLIAVYTDPGWTPVLERAAGVVLETGGVLSHGAIVARELGIPALVGVADATRIIQDGDFVTIDAALGRVTISARRPAPA